MNNKQKTDNCEIYSIDFSKFKEFEVNDPVISCIDELKESEVETLQSVGVCLNDNSKAGKFLLYGATPARTPAATSR